MFWIFALIISLFVAFICFYPLLRQKISRPDTTRETLNKAFYFDRLQEIKRDEQQGLLEHSEHITTDLQQALLDDIPAQQNSPSMAQKQINKVWFFIGFLTLFALAATSYWQVGAWQMEAALEKNHQKLPYFYEKIKLGGASALNDDEIQQFYSALRVQAQKEPNNAETWWLLGQLGIIQAESQENSQIAQSHLTNAYDSYTKAVELAPENSEYKLSFARILMFSQDRSDKFKGEEILKEIVRQDSTNIEALKLLAFHFFEQEDYKMAAVTWAMMLRLLPEDDPLVPLLEKSIRAARDALAEQEQKRREALVPNMSNN